MRAMTTKCTTVIDETVKRNMCINCGVCAAVCPTKAISMIPNAYRETTPCVDKKKCTNCGLCTKFCPHTSGKMLDDATKLSQCEDPERVGLEGVAHYLAYNKIDEERIKSASGGVITKLAIELLDKKKVDAIIHGERLFGKRGEQHFASCISTTREEILNRTGSIYAPLNFQDVLTQVETDKTYFITGTPCFITAVRRLFNTHPKYKKIKIFTCSLICSHNVSELFADFLGQYNNVPGNEQYAINYRNKDRIYDANNYNNHFYTKDRDLLKINRFKSYFTETWRSYSFAMNVCCYCSDLWGRHADISVKDAWGNFSGDPLGKSLCIVRNQEIDDVLNQAQNLHLETISPDIILENQLQQARFKQREALNKLTKSIFSKVNKSNGLRKYAFISKWSKIFYARFGFKMAKRLLKFVIGNVQKHDAFKTIPNSTHEINHNVKKLITIVGGHGNGNVGDEAQNNETIELLKTRYPEYQILNLTPAPDYSFYEHPGCYHDFAGRNLLYDLGGKNDCYFLFSRRAKIRFIFNSLLVLFNAYFVKKDWPVWFINAKKAKMLQILKESSLLYFSGGGYLTGSTLSRLWEGILLCGICKIFGVPVVMSGQTIGVWPDKITKWLACKIFRSVRLITVRDNSFSLGDLAQIGLKGNHIFATHDDALFCKTSTTRQIESDNYICLNFHYWSMSEDVKQLIIEKIHKIVSFLLDNTTSELVFIPMHESDARNYEDYIKIYPSERFSCYKYDYDFKKLRRAIKDSKMCITMKHHPIIFAMGEDVPAISLAFFRYYVHKNLGALEQYGQEACSVNLEDDDWYEQFMKVVSFVLEEKEAIIKNIRMHRDELRQAKERFLAGVDQILRP